MPDQPGVHILSQTALLKTLPGEELERLLTKLKRVEVAPGEYLFREAEPGNYLYVILAGQIEVIKSAGLPGERLLNVLQPGDFLGEMSLFFQGGLRSASARARTALRLLEMGREHFDDLLARYPTLSYELVRVLSQRIQANESAAVRDLLEKNQQLTLAYEQLQAAQAELVEKEKLERELQLARQIQKSVLPNSLPQITGYDFGAIMEPARAVGGDFYDFIPLSKKRLGVVVGDVTDKGMPAAIFMAQTYALLHAEAGRSASPRLALQRVNKFLLDMNASGLFATILYGILEPAERSFTYARAGHELPLSYSPVNGISAPPRQAGQPVGILPNPQLDEQTLKLERESVLLLYTDGVTDAVDPGGGRLGGARLASVFQDVVHLPAQGICDHIFQKIQEHQVGGQQFDDVTLVAMRVD
jgi:serine phosphatase RsbU (regulator of sigma subunit)